ncbi:MAG: FtsQ-type POTRA domain-containing protein [Treponema sp.]|jgi:cell division protein FtsQ|nr:FtsQ-type POTRA domain-containing protein [Treponema sp.]
MVDDNIFTEDILSPDFLSDDIEGVEDIETVADVSTGASPRARALVEKGLKWIVIVIVALISGELLLLLVVNPALPLSRVEVLGMPELDTAMVLKQAGITRRSSYASVNARLVESRLAALSMVASVQVIKRFPNTIRIVLEGRKAVGLFFAMIPGMEGTVQPVYFDHRGVVFQIGSEAADTAAVPAIPVISGLFTEPPYLGMQLPLMAQVLVRDLAAIQANAPELLAAISEIVVHWKTFDRYEVILYPVHNPVRIRLGSVLNEHMLRYVLLVVDVCVSKRLKVEEIDFRTGTASYTLKEVPSGS